MQIALLGDQRPDAGALAESSFRSMQLHRQGCQPRCRSGATGADKETQLAVAGHVDLSRYDQSWYSRGAGPLKLLLWDVVQDWLIRPSPHAAYGWRRMLYRLFGARIGERVHIRRTVRCNYPWKLEIADRAWVGDETTLYALERITIGADAVVSQQAYICTGTHDHRDPAFGLVVKPVVIGHSAWIALGAVVMPGVTVGDGALLGARAVLTRDAQAWTIHLGSPAKPVGPRELRAS